MKKEIRKILYENFGYGDADKATKELLNLFNVSFNDEGVEVCEHEYKHDHTNWYECTKCGYVTSM
jgi:hypothetical protein